MIKVAIDFDGVVVKRTGIPTQGTFENCEPMKGALDSIKLFLSTGFEVYICTNREHYEWLRMKLWLIKYGFPEIRITNKKEKETTVYIDDRAIRFTNWQDIRKYWF